MSTIYLALGTNLGINLHQNLKLCHKLISANQNIKIIKKSTPIKTKPVNMNSKNDFLNQILEIETTLPPEKLLKLIESIETKMGRTSKNDHADRIIDIDIISYDNLILKTRELTIPHPKMNERLFVLLPLKEISPNWKHPAIKKNIEEIIEKVDKTSYNI